MTYEKPAVVTFSAIDVVQGTEKPLGDVQDGNVRITESAYEADE